MRKLAFFQNIFPQPISLIHTNWLGQIIATIVIVSVFFPIIAIALLLSWMFLEIKAERKIPEEINGDFYAAYEMQPLTFRFAIAGILIWIFGEATAWWINVNTVQYYMTSESEAIENVEANNCYNFMRNDQQIIFHSFISPRYTRGLGDRVVYLDYQSKSEPLVASWSKFRSQFPSLRKPVTFTPSQTKKGAKICF